jgi:predicted DNA-binding transcriptional regulator YafY
VERFADCELIQGSSFEDAQPLDLAHEFSDSFGIITSKKRATKVVLQFSQRVRGRIQERTWHHSQQLEELADGQVQLSLEIPSVRECLLWILSWTGDVAVVRPPELRAELMRLYNLGAETNREATV